MKLKSIFILNLKTFVIDLVIFVIGILLFVGLITCRIDKSATGECLECAQLCHHSPLFYLGLILILISIIHFIINLINFIYKKSRKGKRK